MGGNKIENRTQSQEDSDLMHCQLKYIDLLQWDWLVIEVLDFKALEKKYS